MAGAGAGNAAAGLDSTGGLGLGAPTWGSALSLTLVGGGHHPGAEPMTAWLMTVGSQKIILPNLAPKRAILSPRYAQHVGGITDARAITAAAKFTVEERKTLE